MIDKVQLNYPVYMVRHGQTALNLEGRFQGTLDEPLNQLGREEAAKLAVKINRIIPSFELAQMSLHTSPLQRAVMTMDIIVAEIGLNSQRVVTVDNLAEMSFGTWEGLTTLEVKEKFPVERKKRKADRWEFAPKNGESYEMLSHRVGNWLRSLDGPVFAAAHLGVLRVSAVIAGSTEIGAALTMKPEADEIWRFADGKLQRI